MKTQNLLLVRSSSHGISIHLSDPASRFLDGSSPALGDTNVNRPFRMSTSVTKMKPATLEDSKSALLLPCETASTELRSDMDGATVVTLSGSLLLCWPMGSAVAGALGPPPTLKMDTWPKGSVCECGCSSAPGAP